MSRGEYYCCCLRYPPFPSLPLTEQGCSHGWATSTFVGFYCCGEEAIAIEWVRVALPETDRWEPGLQMVRGSLGGRETTRGSKTQGFPRWLSSPLFFPHLACLPACLHPLSASSPARELSCLLDMINGPGLHRIARFGFTLQSQEESCVLLCLLVGRWRVSWSSPQGWGATFFPQICTWLSAFSCANHKRPLTKILSLQLCFPLFLIPPSSGLIQGHWKESFFVFFCWVHRGQATWWAGLSVWSPLVCFLTGLCGAGKGGCLLPNVGLADSIKKISKGPLWGAVKKKGCFESTSRLQG